jgi:hypothetical protein|tara:strand:+ start:832 stop:936 length:105 start_codon:yes stop_codon:yes gene_type:complete
MKRQNHGRRPLFEERLEGFRLGLEDALDFFMARL